MSKGLIIFVVVAATGLVVSVIINMKKSADQAHQRQESILNEFKRVDESLKHSTYAIDSAYKKLPDSLISKPDKIK
ncbi:hypothetical protein [Ferruginibacter sp. SUN106]|uniref:hypothetical protein n=1 Tax=Ferruginibacter sp. SUN106 TaxID=2978348 RepID=UPI003D368D24